MFLGMSTPDVLVIGILAVLLFGPDKLPEFLQNATALVRKVRNFSDQAKEEVRAGLGPEFKDFEFTDLHPRTFVRKQLLGDDGLGLGERPRILEPLYGREEERLQFHLQARQGLCRVP
ncbi:sec-independent translocase, partial [Streptomyces noursei]